MIELIIPPVSDCFMPTLGIAQLAGYLKSVNVDCNVYDIGAEINYRFFDIVKNCNKEIKRMVMDGEEYSYRNLVSSMNYFSLINENFRIGPDYFDVGYDWKDPESTIEYIDNKNALSEFYLKLSSINQIIMKGQELICGLSISYESQVIPALVLSKLLKSKSNKIKICIGGSLLYNYEEIFYKYMYLLDIIDFLIIGPGEIIFEHIAEEYFENYYRCEGIKITQISDRYIIDSRECRQMPIVYEPYFEGFNFDYYPVVNKAFPYMIKDKCYYGRCRFCNGDKVVRHDNCKDVSLAFDMMSNISLQNKINNAYIVDAALSPRDFANIGKLTVKKTISWIANARFERNLTDEELIKAIAQKGCVMLRFGFESGSQKVLDCMNKGTKVEIAERVLFLTYKYNIKSHLYIMFGYPGEGKKERQDTLDFLERNKKYIYSYSVSVFQPIPETPVYKEFVEKVEKHDNEYERILELIYPDEDDYQLLCKDILRVGDILRDYARTNIEYYSANIFNCEEMIDRNYCLIEYNRYLKYYSNSIQFDDEMRIEEKTKAKKTKYVYVDFYNKVTVFLYISEKIVGMLRTSSCGKESKRLEELKKILDNTRNKRKYNYYFLSSLERNVSNEMSIQFIP